MDRRYDITGAAQRALVCLLLLVLPAYGVPAETPAAKPDPKIANQVKASAPATTAANTPANTTAGAKSDAAPAKTPAPKLKSLAKPKLDGSALPGFHYDRLLRAEEFEKYRNPDAVHKIQQDLAIIYHDDPDFLRDVLLGHKPLTDNIMGPVTLFWMQRYCYAFRIEPIGNFADTLIDSIDSFARFSEKHVDGKNVILTHDFGEWMDARPADKLQADYAIRRNGSDVDRLALVAEYLKRPTKSGVKNFPDQIYSYRIDPADIQLLRAKPAILQGLADFPAKPFADVADFDAAVTAALKDVPPEVLKNYLPDIEDVAKVGGYRISDAAIVRMQDTGVPDTMVTASETLLNVLYTSKAELEDAMKAAVDPKDQATFSKFSERMIAAAEIGTYSLDGAGLKRLEQVFSSQGAKPVLPLPVVSMLSEMTGVNYPKQDLFDKASIAKIWYALGTCQSNLPAYDKYVRGLALKDDAYAALKVAVVQSVAGNNAKESEEMSKRFDDMLPYRKMTDFCTADQNKSTQILADQIYSYYRASILDLVRKTPPAREKPVRWSGGAWAYKDGVLSGSCGCVLDDLSGQVYAFYPFWLPGTKPKDATAKAGATGTSGKDGAAAAAGDDDPPQVIDFNVLSRIGFVGFTFDDNGNLKPAPNRYDIDYDFTKVAHSFRSKVDWVIRRDDWSGWNALDNQEQVRRFGVLKQDILDFLGKAGGNGVTLFFNGYPDFDRKSQENDNAIGEFDGFVKELSAALRATGKDYGLNIVLRQPSELIQDSSEHATAKVNDYDHMLKLLQMMNPQDTRKLVDTSDKPWLERVGALIKPQLNSQTRNHILLLIEEPTTDSKKRLRLEIEQALHGEDRHALLSGVIPVIEFDGRNWQQLQDDIIYFKDNFDGVGFWPVNFHQASAKTASTVTAGDSHCDHGETVEDCLVSTYQGYNLNGKDNSLVEKFVCQFHNWFRMLLALQLALFLVAYLVPLFTCYMREWISQNFKLLVVNFVAMTVVGALLFVWDPDLSSTRAHAVIVVLLLLAIAFETLRRRREFILRTVKPSRAKSAMLERSRQSNGDGSDAGKEKPHNETAPAKERYVGVLKAAIRLRTYLESGKTAAAELRRELKSDLAVLGAYLEIDEKEGVNTRLKIMKATQIVMAHAENPGTPVSVQKMRRLAILLWSYLNGNIDCERQVLSALKPFMEKFEEGTTLSKEDIHGFTQVLHQAQQAVARREKTEHEEYFAMQAGMTLMHDNIDREQHATSAVVSAMQVVWQHVDRDELLHGRKQVPENTAAGPGLPNLSNAAPIYP